MDNPIKLILWANVNAMYQYLQFSKNMLDVFFPIHAASQRPAPVLARAAVPVKIKSGGCAGPADLRP